MLTVHARSPNPHEETHLLAYRRFGPCYHTALHEGLPLALERAAGDTSLSVFAAALVADDGVPAVDTLLDEDGVRTMNRRGVGFPACGLFVSWILDSGGLDLLGRLYKFMPLTVADLTAALGVSEERLNESFSAWIAQRAAEGDREYRFQRALAQAGGLGKNGDWTAAAQKLRDALALRPGDPDTLYRLALAEDKAGAPAAAESELRSLLALSAAGTPVAERYVIFGHYQLGRVLEAQGRIDEARVEYRKVLELPDRHGSHGMAREALGKAPEPAPTPKAP
jgi:tetratricopeptide (TPR) repeat protein